MALTRLGTDQISDDAITNAKIHGSAAIAGSKLADNLTYGSNLTVSGNLTVNGTTKWNIHGGSKNDDNYNPTDVDC